MQGAVTIFDIFPSVQNLRFLGTTSPRRNFGALLHSITPVKQALLIENNIIHAYFQVKERKTGRPDF